jgi:hypothetical protein
VKVLVAALRREYWLKTGRYGLRLSLARRIREGKHRTNPSQCKKAGAGLDSPLADPDNVRQFVQSMTSEERMLVVLKRELYEGSWDEMVADLKARLDGRPYIFKLAHRIEEDLERIRRLRSFEDEQKVDLAQYIKLDQEQA